MKRNASHVVFRKVGKRFDEGTDVLADVSLVVASGEFVSIIGPSGCGKSTLLRLASGLTRTTNGELFVDGSPVVQGRNEGAFIFQEATLLPWLTVRRNIELPLRIRGWEAGRRRSVGEEMLGLVRLGHVADRYPRQLSGGMKMRVSVARALAQSPRLLLLDEPFGALDEMTRHHLNEELHEMHRERGWTALFVTHSVAEAVFLSDRILVMAANPGRIHDEIRIALPRERSASTRASAEFHACVDHVSAVLRSVEVAT